MDCFTFIKLPFDQDKSNLKVFSIITMLSLIDNQKLMGRLAWQKTNANQITRRWTTLFLHTLLLYAPGE